MSRVRALFTRPASQPLPEAPARKPLVRQRGVAAPDVTAVGAAPTRERCACGRTYGTGADVSQELRGGHLVAVCGGCAA